MLESGAEVVLVVKNFRANLLLERLGHICRRVGTVDHGAAKRGHVDVAVRRFDKYTTSHSVEDITSTGLRMVVRKYDVLSLGWSKKSDHFLILLPGGGGREGLLRREDSAAIFAV